jgi:Raf kinase inhibitor-like YbhB/YbcL family protein
MFPSGPDAKAGIEMNTTLLMIGAILAVQTTSSPPKGGLTMSLTLTSPAFKNNGEIPGMYTCEGKNISPPLAWTGVPAGTKGLVLVVDDPDAPDPRAPKTTWVHWVLLMPPDATGLLEGAKNLPEGTIAGTNDFKKTGWGGPCPPVGRHRYFFKLYALSETLSPFAQGASPTKAQVETAMKDKVLAHAELMGTYEKQQ